ncbi:MAG TPA: DNA translocase FtsK [Bryobacteraceae bacterium]|nr:DNA translocase FtsK [Bryobacteraceae bacterium]
MRLLGPTKYPRLNEGTGVVLLACGIALVCALVSYYPQDPSFNTAVRSGGRPLNLIGPAGSYTADFLLQLAGLGAFTLPALLIGLAWRWFRSEPVDAQTIKVGGGIALVLSVSMAFSLGPEWHPYGGTFTAGGLLGRILADWLTGMLNPLGAALATTAAIVLSLYLVSKFSLRMLADWFAGPVAAAQRLFARLRSWYDIRRHRRQLAAREAAQERRNSKRKADPAAEPAGTVGSGTTGAVPPWSVEGAAPALRRSEVQAVAQAEPAPEEDEIPIHALEEYLPPPGGAPVATPVPQPVSTAPAAGAAAPAPSKKPKSFFRIPATELLQEAQGRPPYDSQELKDTAARIKARFEEFNVLGTVVQINPGPVVTTFEFKPEAGIKYSRITTLTEDLCLGLQAESVLIERIPGKPTVGIEVPNTRREVISLRQILESDEFRNSSSPLTVSLGKDISGRIKVAALDSMPHLLIAGSTGSGKSVMLNTLIMSILYKATPDEVRMIMVDPKRVELGIYEGIPHLLTPVITDPRKATNALKNAVLEMERRLKLLASHGVRNIDQFNRKVRQAQQAPRTLFDEAAAPVEEPLEPLPYILIIIDELADLMMLERAGVEESVTRLAQMARAVGMHLVLATQRPSVDVITGLIKANFPARISFRVATRVDSRTILDVMGAEHLLGKGDMLFLPPGSSRLTRVHGSYVGENEIEQVVEFWKQQAPPDYDSSFLMAPPAEDGEEPDENEEFDGHEDPMYQDAVKVVLEMGKASTSTLQRRLRLGYGRAARMLDMMQRDGIIGPPDGPRPREVLKRPDWLQEVEGQLR